MKRSRIAFLAGSTALLLLVLSQAAPTSAAPAPNVVSAATIGTITITGSQQGPFTNNGSKTINIHAFQYGISAPHDPQTGLPTGRRQHKPLTITKDLDQTSPEILQAITNNESLTDVVVDVFLTANTPGAKTPVAEYHLQNASINDDNQAAPGSAGRTQEDVSFSFQKITVTIGGKVYTDTNGLPG